MNDTFVTLAGGAVIAVGIAAFTRSRGWSMALPLILGGLVVGWLPVGPTAPPDPEVVLVAVLAPLVFGEALGSSYVDLRKVGRPVIALAVGLVIATTLAVGMATLLVVAMPVAMALALGAVLAPTDAVSVSAVARRAGLPRRLVAILEGESLVNDGTGLTALKVALLAASAGSVTLLEVGGYFALAVTVGVAVGAAGGWLLSLVLRRSKDLVAANAMVLVAPFLLYVIAEELHGSGILAVVAAALVIAHRQNSLPGQSGRVQSAIVWRHITFVLQALAFFLVGLELPDVLGRLDGQARVRVAVLVVVVVVALIVTRALFVAGMVGLNRAARQAPVGHAYLRGAAVLAWAGARGPVSGLAAFSIPLAFASGDVVPYRDLILATTFCVIVVTLLLSMTLAPLARLLKVDSDDDAELIRRIDVMLARAALDRLSVAEAEAEEAGDPIPADVSERLRGDAERRLATLTASEGEGQSADERSTRMLDVARAMLRAEQEELLRLRDEEGLPDAIVRPKLRDLDLSEQALRAERG
ncbi:MAG: cation:proton antiporter [Candidatus Nanopelagicales bacterium]